MMNNIKDKYDKIPMKEIKIKDLYQDIMHELFLIELHLDYLQAITHEEDVNWIASQKLKDIDKIRLELSELEDSIKD